ncbi:MULTISPECIES: phosphate/phosphite/phosphonate ABC transporter substrate-binding protein [Marinobacter]|uniref:Phosphonate transport system substrate-binding protein n=1 Tax=Marinobacter nauticus TaxID=2743 RepID=A0A368X2E7_MARNT|nr:MULTISPECIES: phosphate/phosphite/phosphonate ABC transporter substrate-binding protein [Marinobacter]AMQ88761.1 phosphonate ABC transporter substrate-binding protein [Marinobacter sp. LQ44]RCW62192.1 phosphonate transport system substrate-binding protein [Marinobacter nauticus]
MRLLTLILAFASLAFASFYSSGAVREVKNCNMNRLTFTMIPKKDIDQQASEYQSLIALLEQGLGMPVELVRATSYESVMDGVLSGGVDLAVMGPASYVIAHRTDPGLDAFASLTTEAGLFTPEGSFYYSLLVVPTAAGINSIEGLRNARILLTDPSSTSGALIPKNEFATTIGEPFSDFFGANIYAGSHDKALMALLDNKAEAAFVSSSRADEALRRGMIAEDTLTVLWRSVPLHYDPFVFRSGICEDVRSRVINLLTTPSPMLSEYLNTQRAVGINLVTYDDYRAIEAVLNN